MLVIKWVVALTSAVLIAACGGGGGSPGTQPGVTPPTTGGITTIAADLVVGFENNKNSLRNTGSDLVRINVTTVNSTGNAIADVPVTIQVNNGGVFLGNSAPDTVTGEFRTDATGLFSGVITSPGNRANRDIAVIIKSGNAQRTATISVTGSKITITPVPGAPLAGAATALNLRLVDAGDVGIPDTDLTISGTSGFTGVVRTNSTGDAVFNGTAPATAGTSTISVSGSGVATTIPLTVISPSGGGIPNAIGPVGPGSLSATPTNIQNNLTVASNNKSVVTFKVLNASNQGVQNVRVQFKIFGVNGGPPLGAGERMSTGDAIVYTNTAGEVSSDYIPGTRSSPTDGVEVRACYGLTDATISACSLFVDTKLTVAGQALNLSIASNNTLAGLFNNTIYVKTLVIKVADSAGNPVRDAVISASLDITHYAKGRIWNAPVAAPSNGIPTRADTYTNTLSETLIPTSVRITTTTFSGFNVWCLNEDLSRNGTRDADEDLDKDGVLEPRASDITISTPNGNKTDANGNLLLDVQWGQNVGVWLAYTVKATTNVAGSEGTNSASFITDVLQADVPNGSFLTPPYGINNCSTNN
jgi:hypothetical protein